MHEMSILSNVMDVALKYAKENNAREVVSVTLCRNTIVKDATLHMEKVPLKAQRNQCRLVFPADIKRPETLVCPDCGSKEFLIKSIEIA